MEKKIKVLCDLGVGGERGRVFDSKCVIGALSSTDYKDPPKVIKRLDKGMTIENALQDKTRQDKTRQDKTRQDNSYCWSNRQYGQAEPRQSKSDIRERSDLFLESPYKQRSTSDTKKIFKPYRVLNDYNGLCRTIKTQYFKNSVDNFLSKSSFGATGVIRKLEKDKSDRTDE